MPQRTPKSSATEIRTVAAGFLTERIAARISFFFVRILTEDIGCGMLSVSGLPSRASTVVPKISLSLRSRSTEGIVLSFSHWLTL